MELVPHVAVRADGGARLHRILPLLGRGHRQAAPHWLALAVGAAIVAAGSSTFMILKPAEQAGGDSQALDTAPATAPPIGGVGAPAVRMGLLRLTGVPQGADVTIGGRARAGSQFELNPGSYPLRVEAAGFNSFTASVTIRSDDTVDLPVSLVPASGELRLSGLPPGARVFVDDVPMTGNTTALEAGEHPVRVAATGYEPLQTSVRIEAGQRVDLPVRLRPTLSEFRIANLPPGARVLVDSSLQSGPPFRASIGRHEILVTADYYEEFRAFVTLAPDAVAQVTYNAHRLQGRLLLRLNTWADIYLDGRRPSIGSARALSAYVFSTLAPRDEIHQPKAAGCRRRKVTAGHHRTSVYSTLPFGSGQSPQAPPASASMP